MAKKPVKEVEQDNDDDLDIQSTDYGFIIDTDGNLKTMFMSEEELSFKELPKPIKKILKIFNIAGFDDIEEFASKVLH